MSADSKALLEEEFQRDPNWDRRKIASLAQRLQISRTKVYKWNWDRKKSLKVAGTRGCMPDHYATEIPSGEISPFFAKGSPAIDFASMS